MTDNGLAKVTDGQIAPRLSSPKVVRGYPLSLLFLLVAAAAIVVSQLMPLGPAVIRERLSMFLVIGSAVGFGVVCMILGVIVGLMSPRKIVGMIHGALVGILLGPVIGPLLVMPRDSLSRTMASAAGGCAVILLMATFTRLTQRPRDEQAEFTEE